MAHFMERERRRGDPFIRVNYLLLYKHLNNNIKTLIETFYFHSRFCLMKLPSRPLVLSSPIPIGLLPTRFLQDRMQLLLPTFLQQQSLDLNGHLNRSSSSSSSSASLPPDPPKPLSLIMGPTRLVEAFLLYYEIEQPLHSAPIPLENDTYGMITRTPSITSFYTPLMTNASTASTTTTTSSLLRTVKPLWHTRITSIPPAVSLSEGFVVRLADQTDDLRVNIFYSTPPIPPAYFKHFPFNFFFPADLGILVSSLFEYDRPLS